MQSMAILRGLARVYGVDEERSDMKTSKVFQSESKQGCIDLMQTWIQAEQSSPAMSVQLNALGGVTVQTRRHYEPHTPKFCGYTNKGEEIWESVLVIY